MCSECERLFTVPVSKKGPGSAAFWAGRRHVALVQASASRDDRESVQRGKRTRSGTKVVSPSLTQEHGVKRRVFMAAMQQAAMADQLHIGDEPVPPGAPIVFIDPLRFLQQHGV